MKKISGIIITISLLATLFSCLIGLNKMVEGESTSDNIKDIAIISEIANAEENTDQENDLNVVMDDNTVIITTGEILNEYKMMQPKTDGASAELEYISELTNFSYEDSQYLMDKCEEKGVDVFLVLAVFNKESGFNPDITGGSGEIGLGQIMEATAKAYCQQLGYDFSRELVYDIKVNIDITVENLDFLLDYYSGNLHSALTAYNRGMGGLKTYIAEGRSPFYSANMSTYSVSVENYANMFEEEFQNTLN